MPELPEVETVVRGIAPYLLSHTILRAELRSHRVTRGDWEATEAGLTGARVEQIRRQGKQIFVQLDKGILYIHLGMTGKLLWNAAENKFTRAVLDLDNGCMQFNDIRQFGRVEFFAETPEALQNRGPDALTVDFGTFYERLKRYRGSIKAVLLNQSFVSGIGNIYADEILFAARVHPRAGSSRISKRRAELIHKHTLEILSAAVAMRGSSISDYVDPCGDRGEFQLRHQVYGRTGETCTVCGHPLRRIVVAQRGTHYCVRCQRP